jgi:oligopeptide/dipeptide ABC transporter ATP-binding protein
MCSAEATADRPLLEARQLRRCYPARGLVARGEVVAVDDVSFEVMRGQAFGVVGESGCGKSTLMRLLLALERPDSGTVTFDGTAISHLGRARVRPLRRRFQAVFQEPTASLNPYLRVATIIAEPLAAHGIAGPAERRQRVCHLLQSVGLPPGSEDRYPEAFSAGQRQRIAIARALAPEPELLVLDEPLSSLDVSVQAQILAILNELRRRLDLTLLLVSHDLEVVRQCTERVAIMFGGRFVEVGPTEAVLERPAHPYTRALLAAAPIPDPSWRPPQAAEGDGGHQWPSPACRYAPRCPMAESRCQSEPRLLEVADDHRAACWVSVEER